MPLGQVSIVSRVFGLHPLATPFAGKSFVERSDRHASRGESTRQTQSPLRFLADSVVECGSLLPPSQASFLSTEFHVSSRGKATASRRTPKWPARPQFSSRSDRLELGSGDASTALDAINGDASDPTALGRGWGRILRDERFASDFRRAFVAFNNDRHPASVARERNEGRFASGNHPIGEAGRDGCARGQETQEKEVADRRRRSAGGRTEQSRTQCQGDASRHRASARNVTADAISNQRGDDYGQGDQPRGESGRQTQKDQAEGRRGYQSVALPLSVRHRRTSRESSLAFSNRCGFAGPGGTRNVDSSTLAVLVSKPRSHRAACQKKNSFFEDCPNLVSVWRPLRALGESCRIPIEWIATNSFYVYLRRSRDGDGDLDRRHNRR